MMIQWDADLFLVILVPSSVSFPVQNAHESDPIFVFREDEEQGSDLSWLVISIFAYFVLFFLSSLSLFDAKAYSA